MTPPEPWAAPERGSVCPDKAGEGFCEQPVQCPHSQYGSAGLPDVPEGRSCPGWVCARISPGLNEDKPTSSRTLLGDNPADNPRPASGWRCPAESARSSPLPPLLPLIEISTQYYFNPHPLPPPPPLPFPAGSLSPHAGCRGSQ